MAGKNRRVGDLDAIRFHLENAAGFLDKYERFFDGRHEGAPYFGWAGEEISRAARLGGNVSELAKRLKTLRKTHDYKINLRYDQIVGNDNPLSTPRAA